MTDRLDAVVNERAAAMTDTSIPAPRGTILAATLVLLGLAALVLTGVAA